MPDNWYIEKFLQNGKNTVTTNLGKEKIVALIHYNMGNICLEKHEYKLALKNYRRTLNLMPEFTEARGNMAIGLERSGYLDRALHELLLLKKNGQHNIDKNIAILYLKKGDFKNAKTFFLNALRESEKDNEILYGLAVSEYNLRN